MVYAIDIATYVCLTRVISCIPSATELSLLPLCMERRKHVIRTLLYYQVYCLGAIGSENVDVLKVAATTPLLGPLPAGKVAALASCLQHYLIS